MKYTYSTFNDLIIIHNPQGDIAVMALASKISQMPGFEFSVVTTGILNGDLVAKAKETGKEEKQEDQLKLFVFYYNNQVDYQNTVLVQAKSEAEARMTH